MSNKTRSLYVRYGEHIAKLDGRGYACSYCGTALVPPGIPLTDPAYYQMFGLTHKGIVQGTVDHVVPKSKGGVSHVDNYVLSCRNCNASKQARSLTEWKGT
jgi:hypothetical protein